MFGDCLANINVAILPLLVQLLQLTLQNGLAVTITGSQLEVLIANGGLFLFLDILNL